MACSAYRYSRDTLLLVTAIVPMGAQDGHVGSIFFLNTIYIPSTLK